MTLKHCLMAGFAAGVICLQACGGSAAPDPSTPDGSIMANVEAFKSNDVSAIVDNMLTPEQKADAAKKWDEQRKKEPNEGEKQRFEAQMKSVTSGEFIDQMMPMVEAQLAQVNSEQLAGMVGMLAGGALNSPDLDAQQKEQAKVFLGSLTDWIKSADVANPEKVRSAMKVVQSTATKLNLKTMSDMQALSFDQLLDKGDVVLGGVKEALAIYDISIDKMLNSVSIDKVEQNGDAADVTVSFEIFGTKQTVTTNLKKINGKWAEAKSADKLNEQLNKLKSAPGN